MPKYKLSDDVKKLNPDILEVTTIGADSRTYIVPQEDKKHLFLDTWKRYAPNGVPGIMAEYRFSAERQFRFDVAFVQQKLAVEIDGGGWMVVNGKAVGRHNKDADLEKGNIAACLGWRILHFSPTMLTNDPYGCVMTVVKAINYGTNS